MQTLKARQVKFDFPVKRYWHSYNPVKTQFYNALSLLFPVGERFFIDSVRCFREQITDLKLKVAIKGFIAQEASHTKHHLEFNQLIESAGYDLTKLNQHLKRVDQLIRRRVSKRGQLAITCATEHFTAIIAQAIFDNPDWLKGSDAEYAKLWRYHAIEEIEHRSVCFDVYQSVDGSYLRRIFYMMITTFLFNYLIIRNYMSLLHQDKQLKMIKTWYQGFMFLWGKPGVLRRLIPAYLKYYQYHFHPDDTPESDIA